MSAEPTTERTPLADNIERTVERTALRKVRKLVDVLEAEEAAKRRLEKRAMWIAGAIGGVAIVWLVWSLIASDQKFERGQTIQLPAKVVVPAKE